MVDKYILDEDGNPEPCDDLMRWARWFEGSDRVIGRHKYEGAEVSTVFLGMKHGDCLYETMVFGGELDQLTERYQTKAEAAKGHLEVIEKVKKVYKPNKDK